MVCTKATALVFLSEGKTDTHRDTQGELPMTKEAGCGCKSRTAGHQQKVGGSKGPEFPREHDPADNLISNW